MEEDKLTSRPPNVSTQHVSLTFSGFALHEQDSTGSTTTTSLTMPRTNSSKQPGNRIPIAQVWLSGVIPGYNPATATSAKPASPRTRAAQRILQLTKELKTRPISRIESVHRRKPKEEGKLSIELGCRSPLFKTRSHVRPSSVLHKFTVKVHLEFVLPLRSAIRSIDQLARSVGVIQTNELFGPALQTGKCQNACLIEQLFRLLEREPNPAWLLQRGEQGWSWELLSKGPLVSTCVCSGTW